MNKKINTIFIIGIFIILAAAIFAYGREPAKLLVFYSPGCHKCIEAENNLIPRIKDEFKGKVEIEYRDITDIENYKLLISLRDKYDKSLEIALPVFFMEGGFLNGKSGIETKLRQFVRASLNKEVQAGSLPAVDFVIRFRSFVPMAIAIAGLEDGINPCAFTVIVFFISFLALQGYRRKELASIGLSFIFAVFLTYLSIGVGIFNFVYHLKGFWIIVKLINICVGILSIILGISAIYDFRKFKQTGNTEGLILQLPKSIKNRIHSVIGLHYRRGKTEEGRVVKPHFMKLISSAFITGFLVSLLEAVCTGQLYLPTITFVLKTTPLKLPAFGYLVLYNLMFIVPLLIIFLFALLGVTSEVFSRILKRYLGLIKILMAVLFLSLGIFLLWRA